MTDRQLKIVYTLTDEAPALATYSLLPFIKKYTEAADVVVELSDISVAARILAAFPENLTEEQRVPDNLAALGELTKMAAMEFAPRIRVNGICPGVIMPGVTRSQAYIEWRNQGIPLARKGEAEELGKALLYLLDNEYVTGQQLFVDGGETVQHIGLNAEDYTGD